MTESIAFDIENDSNLLLQLPVDIIPKGSNGIAVVTVLVHGRGHLLNFIVKRVRINDSSKTGFIQHTNRNFTFYSIL